MTHSEAKVNDSSFRFVQYIARVTASSIIAFILTGFYILPPSFQRLVIQLTCSILINYLVIAFYMLGVHYSVLVTVIVCTITLVAVVGIGVYVTHFASVDVEDKRLLRLKLAAAAHRNISLYEQTEEDTQQPKTHRTALTGSTANSSSLRTALWSFLTMSSKQTTDRNNYTSKSSFLTVFTDDDGDMKSDLTSITSSSQHHRGQKRKPRQQLEVVPEQSEHNSEENSKLRDDEEEEPIPFKDSRGGVNNMSSAAAANNDGNGGRSVKQSPGRRYRSKGRRERDRKRHRQQESSDADSSHGPGSTISKIGDDEGEGDNGGGGVGGEIHAHTVQSGTVMSDITTPLESGGGPLSGPGSIIHSYREDKGKSHPMWQ